ncbi:MAG TPA: hypothetical protein VKU82_02795 [Planctomycetaceae bacterium]|nr:hypothetical protein [Planctomycetaceae bacterium]
MIRLSTRQFTVSAVGAALAFLLAVAFSIDRRHEAVAEGNKSASDAGEHHVPAPVLEVKQLMDVFNMPLYRNLKKDMKGKPDGDDAWRNVENGGLQATEIANLTAMRNVPQSAASTLHANAARLQSAGLALAKSAKAKDYDQARKDWISLVRACNGCHKEMAPSKGPQLEP